jgi:hypothetical protein
MPVGTPLRDQPRPLDLVRHHVARAGTVHARTRLTSRGLKPTAQSGPCPAPRWAPPGGGLVLQSEWSVGGSGWALLVPTSTTAALCAYVAERASVRCGGVIKIAHHRVREGLSWQRPDIVRLSKSPCLLDYFRANPTLIMGVVSNWFASTLNSSEADPNLESCLVVAAGALWRCGRARPAMGVIGAGEHLPLTTAYLGPGR